MIGNTPRPDLRPFCAFFCLNAPRRCTPLNLPCIFLAVTPFRRFICINLSPFLVIGTSLLLCAPSLFYYHFAETQGWRKTRTWGAKTKQLEELGVNGRILQLILNEWMWFLDRLGFVRNGNFLNIRATVCNRRAVNMRPARDPVSQPGGTQTEFAYKRTNYVTVWTHYFVEWMVVRLGIVFRSESNGQTKKFWQGGCKHASSSSMRPRYLLLIQSLGYVTCCILYMERNGAYLRSCTPTLSGEIEGQGHGKLILPGTWSHLAVLQGVVTLVIRYIVSLVKGKPG